MLFVGVMQMYINNGGLFVYRHIGNNILSSIFNN